MYQANHSRPEEIYESIGGSTICEIGRNDLLKVPLPLENVLFCNIRVDHEYCHAQFNPFSIDQLAHSAYFFPYSTHRATPFPSFTSLISQRSSYRTLILG
jgi:hypothetical protein